MYNKSAALFLPHQTVFTLSEHPFCNKHYVLSSAHLVKMKNNKITDQSVPAVHPECRILHLSWNNIIIAE